MKNHSHEFLTVLIKGHECHLSFGKYTNGTIAITATLKSGEPYTTITVNYEDNWEGLTPYAKTFKFPVVVVKNYSENEGIVKELEDAGVIEKGGAYLSGSLRTVEVRKLTSTWEREARKQMAANYQRQ